MSNFFKRLSDDIIGYFTLTPYLIPQPEAEAAIREGVSFRGTNSFILILAILIASLGLNTNSTAVIIGAMLISPLMGPIIGIGLGVGIYDFGLIKRGLRNLSVAALISILASAVYFLISPVSEGHSELLARTSPTIYDVLIGFVGGGAGIIGIGSRSKGNVIPGVAIATALMPPLCTAGYGLATWQMNYFIGATYLFIINSIYIALATFIGVKIMGYNPVAFVNAKRGKKVRRTVYLLSILTMLPSIYLTYTMLRQTKFEMQASEFVNAEFNFPGTQVLSYKAYIADRERHLNVTLIGKVLPQDSLQMAMSSQLGAYGLKGTALNIIQGYSQPTAPDLETGISSVKDIYQLAQASLTRQQETIDSLRSVLAFRSDADSVSVRIAPEIKVLFPQIRGIAISRCVFANVSDNRLDTVNVALLEVIRPLPQASKTKLTRYLEARLSLKHIDLIENPPHTASK